MRPVGLALRHGRLTAAVAVGLTAAAVGGITQLHFDDDYRRVFRSGSPTYRLIEELSGQFGADDQELVVLVEGRNLLAPEGLDALARAEARFGDVPDVAGVQSILSSFPLRRPGRDDVLGNPLLAGRFVTRDGEATIVLVQLAARATAVADLEPVLADIRSAAADAVAAAGLGVSITGMPVLRTEIVRGIQRDQIVFTVVGALASALVILAIFRRLAAVILIGLPPAVGAIWTMGALGWMHEPLNVINNVLPLVVLVIGLADAVHLVHRIHAHRNRGAARGDAVGAAVRDVGLACVLTSLTTAIGFGSLAVAPMAIIGRFGLAAAAGVAISLVAVLVLTPLLAATRIGDRAWRPSARHRPEQPWSAWLEPALARPLVVTVTAVLLLAGFVATGLRLRPDYRYSEYLPEEGQTARVLARVDSRFGGALPLHVLVEWPDRGGLSPDTARAIADVQAAMEADPAFHGPLSVLDTLEPHGLPGEEPERLVSLLPLVRSALTPRLVREDLGRALITARVADTGAARLAPALDALEARLDLVRSRHPGLRIETTGLLVLAARSSLDIIRSLAATVSLAAVLIGVVLAAAFRSLTSGLASIVPNVLPLASLAAGLVVVGRPLQYTSATVFSVALGIVVDDTIHLLTGYRRARRAGLTREPAVRGALDETAPAMVMTTAIFVTGFSALLLSTQPLVRLFGLLSSAAFVIGLLADLLVLPALLTLPGRWPPRSGRAERASTRP